MSAPNALDLHIRSTLLGVILESEETDEELAARLGMGPAHLKRVLDGTEGCTTRDIMLILSAGVKIPFSPGLFSGRRGCDYVRPMVFRSPDDKASIDYAQGDIPVGLDVVCEDVDGVPVTVKISAGVATDIAQWVLEHRPEWVDED